jgi:hypothetical protein
VRHLVLAILGRLVAVELAVKVMVSAIRGCLGWLLIAKHESGRSKSDAIGQRGTAPVLTVRSGPTARRPPTQIMRGFLKVSKRGNESSAGMLVPDDGCTYL